MSAAGDVNGDGYDDLIIGASDADPGGDSSAGESYVVFGKASGFAASLDLSSLDGANGFRLDGIDADDRSGTSVSAAGDVNGDGFGDLVVGALGADPGGCLSAGESYVVFGKASGFAASVGLSTLNGSNGFRLDGIDTGDLSGRSVAAAGDVNGDGYGDVAVSEPYYDFGSADWGQVHVYHGSPAGPGSTPDWTMPGPQMGRMEAGELSLTYAAVDIVQIAERAVDDITTRKTGHIFHRPDCPAHPQVWADADRLYVVLANLVDNAAKYSPPQGKGCAGAAYPRSGSYSFGERQRARHPA